LELKVVVTDSTFAEEFVSIVIGLILPLLNKAYLFW